MTMLDREKLLAAAASFNTRFNEALAVSTPKYRSIASEYPSDAPIETYNWLGEVPLMKRWIDERELEKLRAEKYQIENFDWANGIQVSRDDLRDDRLGLVVPRIQTLARAGLKRIDSEVFNVLNNAFSAAGGIGFDGQPLCSTTHTAAGSGGAPQSNTSTDPLTDATFEAGIVAMTGIKDEKGEPVEIFPTHLATGPALWPVARRIVQQTTRANGEENLNRSLVDYVMSPRITGNKWFLIDMSQGVGPIIVQMRQPPTFRDPNLDGNAEWFFMRKDYRYGADMTFGVGLGLWQTIRGSTGS